MRELIRGHTLNSSQSGASSVESDNAMYHRQDGATPPVPAGPPPRSRPVPPRPSGPLPSEEEVDHSPWIFVSRVSARLGRASGRLSGRLSQLAGRRTSHVENSDAIDGDAEDDYVAGRASIKGGHRRGTFAGRRSTLFTRGARRSTLIPKILQRDPDQPAEYAFEEDGASSNEDDLETVEAGTLPSTATKREFAVAKVRGGVRGAGMAAGHQLAEKKIAQRVWLALIAVCWLWLTSYGVARWIVSNFIPVPALQTVTDINSFAYATSIEARGQYAQDVSNVADICEEDFNRTYRQENIRRDTWKVFNQNQLDWLAGNITFVEAYYNITQTRLDQLETAGDIDLSNANFRTSSTAEECKLMDGIIAGEASAINSLNAASAYRDTSEKAAEDLAYQLERRRRYDDEYFANKTLDIQDTQQKMAGSVHNMSASFDNVMGFTDELKECMVADGTCSSGTPIFKKLESMATSSTSFFTNLQNQAISYKASAEAQMVEYNKTITTLRNNFGLITDAIGSVGIVPDESDSAAPDFDPTVYSFSGVMGTSAVTDGFDSMFASMTGGLSSEGASLESEQDTVRQNSVGWEAGWTDDYQPPDVNVDLNATLDSFSQSGDAFMTSFSDGLSSLSSSSSADAVEDASSDVSSETIEANISSSDVLAKLTDHSEWDFYAYDDSIIAQVSGGIEEMSDLILIFDIIFRIFQTFLIIQKYWSLTGLATPPGDARIKSDYGAGWGPQQTPLQKMAALILNPIVITLLSVTAVAVVFSSFWYAYSPLYYEYVDSCTSTDWRGIEAGEANGTMLYRNAYSAVFQFACSDGDALAQSRTDDINVGKDVECSKQSFDDTVLYNAQVDRFNELNKRFYSTVSQNAALVECLNLAYIDTQLGENFQYRTSRPNFDYVFGPLSSSAIYNCTNVQGCASIRGKDQIQSQAEGPDTDLLRSVMFDASCSSEYWLHATLFAGISVMAVFIILNISRVMGSRALVRVLWRYVVVRNFSVLISVDDRGDIVYPERVTEKGDTMQEAIRLAVRSAIRRWELWGWAMLFTSFAMNAPWIWALVWVSKTIEFNSQN